MGHYGLVTVCSVRPATREHQAGPRSLLGNLKAMPGISDHIWPCPSGAWTQGFEQGDLEGGSCSSSAATLKRLAARS